MPDPVSDLPQTAHPARNRVSRPLRIGRQPICRASRWPATPLYDSAVDSCDDLALSTLIVSLLTSGKCQLIKHVPVADRPWSE